MPTVRSGLPMGLFAHVRAVPLRLVCDQSGVHPRHDNLPHYNDERGRPGIHQSEDALDVDRPVARSRSSSTPGATRTSRVVTHDCGNLQRRNGDDRRDPWHSSMSMSVYAGNPLMVDVARRSSRTSSART